MRIRDLLAAHDARFISVSDLLAAVAEAENVTTQEAARAISILEVFRKANFILRRHLDGEYLEAGSDAACFLLDNTVGAYGSSYPSEEAEQEMEDGEPGFFRDEIRQVLELSGITVPDCISAWRAEEKEDIRHHSSTPTSPQASTFTPQQKTAETKQSDTRLTIIAALAKKAGIDPTKHGAATRIAQATDEIGAPLSDDTVRDVLKGMKSALERRNK